MKRFLCVVLVVFQLLLLFPAVADTVDPGNEMREELPTEEYSEEPRDASEDPETASGTVWDEILDAGVYASEETLLLSGELVLPSERTLVLKDGALTLEPDAVLTVEGTLYIEGGSLYAAEGATLVNAGRIHVSDQGKVLVKGTYAQDPDAAFCWDGDTALVEGIGPEWIDRVIPYMDEKAFNEALLANEYRTLTAAIPLTYCMLYLRSEALADGSLLATVSTDAAEPETLAIRYRLLSDGAEENPDWTVYDLTDAPEIPITETCILELTAEEPEQELIGLSFSYVVAEQPEEPEGSAEPEEPEETTEPVEPEEPAENGSKAGGAPTISTQPSSQTVCAGEVVSFVINASNATKYQWYYLTPNSDTWAAVTAASGKTANYSFTSAERHDGYQYRCTVSNDAGSTTSKVVSLTVIKPIVIVSQPANQSVKVGETAAFTFGVNNAASYQWYYQTPGSDTWNAVTSGGKNATYSLVAASRHDGYQYRCAAINALGTVTSNIAVLTIKKAPVITEQPTDQSVAAGKSVTFRITATDATKYQWYYQKPDTDTWTAVTSEGGKTAAYSFTAAARHDGYKYRCEVSNDGGTAVSTVATLSILPKPTITTQPESQTVGIGKTVTFEVVATGATQYQWYYLKPDSDTWTAVTSGTGKTAAYSFTAAARHDGYKYRCVVTNDGGSVTSSAAKLTVLPKPVFTTQPISQSVVSGQTVTFSVAASNATKYQWYYFAPGADAWAMVTSAAGKTANYSFTAASRHNEYMYRCVASNDSGSVTSSAATLTIIQKPTITTQPTDQTVYVGQTATFTVASSDAEQYQWYYKSPSGEWTAATSASSKTATYVFTPVAWQSGYKFRCLVSNVAGTTTSDTGVLTVVSAPTITTQPTKQTVYAGQTVTFTVAADNAETYQWYYLAPGADAWTAVTTGGKTATYSFTAAARHDGYQYRCAIGNPAGTTMSNIVLLEVISKPTITMQPTKQTVYVGQTVTFTVAADNAETYQWYYFAPGAEAWAPVTTGGKAATYSFTAAARHDGYKYRCVVGNPAGTTTTNAIPLTVISKPTITTQPADQTIVYGNTVTFEVVASNATAYQWYFKSPSGEWTAASSASSMTAKYTFTPQSWHNGYKFRCVVSNPAGTATSSAATLTVKNKPTITTQPTDQSVKEGETATFKVVASGATKYQWYYMASGSSTWSAVSSSRGRTATYSFTVAARHNGYKYKCVVSNDVGSVTSDIVTLTVKCKPTITTQPTNQTVNAGKTVSFKVVASNATAYQWYYMKPDESTWHAVTSGGTSATYSFTAQAQHNGYKYYCVVSNSVGTAASNIVTLTVNFTTVYRALLIGENDYVYYNPLHGCINDMNTIAGALKGLSNKFTIKTLPNSTRSEIISAIGTAYSGATESDVSLFYYSGHGGFDEDTYMGCICPIDGGDIDFDDLATALSKVKGRVIVILDSCHSGSSIGKSADANPDSYIASAIEAFAKAEENPEKCAKWADLSTSKFVVIAAASYNEYSYDWYFDGSGYRQGAFTAAFANGLGCCYPNGQYFGSNGEMPADTNGDHVLTLGEIYNYTYDMALSWTEDDGGQHAQYYGDTSEVLFKRDTHTSFPTITSHPNGASVYAGDTVTFSVTATNATSYRWYYLSPSTNTWAAVTATSGKTATYSFTAEERHDGYMYYCEVSNSAGTLLSYAVTLNVQQKVTPVEITKQPESQVGTIGDTVSFKVVAKNATSYEWCYWSNDYEMISCPNGNKATYTFVVTEADLQRTFFCMVRNSGDEEMSYYCQVYQDVDQYDVQYNFSNSRSSFGYSADFRIPIDRYKRFYDDDTALYFYNLSGTWFGSCFGMSTTAGMMYSDHSSLDPSWFNSSYEFTTEISVNDYSSKLGITAQYMIECAQVMWWCDEVVIKYNNTDNSGDQIQNIINTVKSGLQNGDLPVICVYSSNGGHAILGTGVRKISSTETWIMVYDCNFPNYKDRHIVVKTNTSGTPTSWSYKINDSDSCNRICLVEYSGYDSAWRTGNGFSVNSFLSSDAKNFTILNSEGQIVGRMTDGVFISMQEDVCSMKPLDSINAKDIIRMPAGTYTIVNNGTEPLELDVIHNKRRAIVSIESGSVTLTVNSIEKVNAVQINEDARGSYRILLSSSEDRYGKVEYSGVCDGTVVLAGIRNNKLELCANNATQIRVNGVDLPVAAEHAADTNDPEIAVKALTADDTLTLTVKNRAGRAILGEMAVVSYDADGNVIGVCVENVSIALAKAEMYRVKAALGAAKIRIFILDPNSLKTLYTSKLIDR